MSLYGHTNINIDALKRWADSLSFDKISQVEIGGQNLIVDENVRKILEMQLVLFKESVKALKEGDDWRVCQYNVSSAFLNAVFRMNYSSIRIADFYECLIIPSNVKTYKKIVKGFDYVDVGGVHVKDTNGNLIASVGKKSDLIWSVFYEYFINSNEDGSFDYVYSNHEQIMSIQLFGVEDLTFEELNTRVAEILIQVSVEHEMDFKVYEVDDLMKLNGSCDIRDMVYNPTGFEQIPMLYLQNGINSNDERLSFLSFYQVMEYFFVRTQNYSFLNELQKIDMSDINHSELRKILIDYRKIASERETLKLVLRKSIDINKFKSWIASNVDYEDIYCNSTEFKIDITKEDNKIISGLVERVYSFRCSIAHAKGDMEEYIAIPELSKKRIASELPLIKYLAFEVIRNCSEVSGNGM